jgi:hypothetical protein
VNTSLPHRRHLVTLTLIVWLCAIWGGLHGHFCFDGQDPAISIHMDLLAGHPEHHHDDQSAHVDTDADLVESFLFKLTKLELPAALATLLFLLFAIIGRQFFSHTYSQTPRQKNTSLRPPLRAPPVFSS